MSMNTYLTKPSWSIFLVFTVVPCCTSATIQIHIKTLSGTVKAAASFSDTKQRWLQLVLVWTTTSSSSSFSVYPAISLRFTIFGEIFEYVTIFQSNHRGSHILSSWMMHAGCVFEANIHQSGTWMSGPLSLRDEMHVCADWTSVCTLSWKNSLGNGVRTHVNSKGKITSTARPRGRLNPWCCIMKDSQPNTLPTELFPPQDDHWGHCHDVSYFTSTSTFSLDENSIK